MNNGGWLKFYRKITESQVFVNPLVLKAWVWCLSKAATAAKSVSVGNQTVELLPGEFITGRHSAAESLHMPGSTAWRCLERLEKLGNLDIKKTNKFSIVKVKKWSLYQQAGQQTDNKRTTDGHKERSKEVKNTPLTPQRGAGKSKLFHGNDLCAFVGDQLRIKGASGWVDWSGGAAGDFRYGDLTGEAAYRKAREDNQRN